MRLSQIEQMLQDHENRLKKLEGTSTSEVKTNSVPEKVVQNKVKSNNLRKKVQGDGSNDSVLETRSNAGEEIKDEQMPVDVDNHADTTESTKTAFTRAKPVSMEDKDE